jgi:hypothetical protein
MERPMRSFYLFEFSIKPGGARMALSVTDTRFTEIQLALDLLIWFDLEHEMGFLFSEPAIEFTVFQNGDLARNVGLSRLITISGAGGDFTVEDLSSPEAREAAEESFRSGAHGWCDWSGVPVEELREPLLRPGERVDGQGRFDHSDWLAIGYEDTEAGVEGTDIREYFQVERSGLLTVNPDWLKANDGAVRRVAESILAERRFGELAVLADALEEAGCTNDFLLAHCRLPPAHHAHGSWPLPMLLAARGE